MDNTLIHSDHSCFTFHSHIVFPSEDHFLLLRKLNVATIPVNTLRLVFIWLCNAGIQAVPADLQLF